MIDPVALVQQHAAAIIETLVQMLNSPNGRTRLKAAKLLLRWGSGPPGQKRRGSVADAGAAGGLSAAELQRALDTLLPHLRPEPKGPNPSTTSCPARQRAAAPADTSSRQSRSQPHVPRARRPGAGGRRQRGASINPMPSGGGRGTGARPESERQSYVP